MTAPDPMPLPELPKPAFVLNTGAGIQMVYTADQMNEHARAALEAEKAEVFRLRDALAQAKGVPEGFVPRSAVEPLLTALRFYARGEHYHLDDDEDFDTVSGEPDNWLMSGRDGSSTMVEDGRVAQFALLGKPVNWKDGTEDETPQPIEGEVLAATPPSPAQAAGWRDIEIERLRADAAAESESRAMFIARLEEGKKRNVPELTIDAVLALLNDCDYLASRAKTKVEIVECDALHCPICGYVPKSC